MPNGDTPMQYPFPYKNSSGDGGASSTNTNPTFVSTTTDTLLVTGNATFQGIIDAEIIVGTLISGTSFTGQGTASGIIATTQKNVSTNPAAYAGLYAIDNNNQTVGVYAYGSSHATRPSTGWLECTTPLKIKGTTTSLYAGTNEVLIATGSNVQLPFLTATRPVSTDSSNNLVSASITGTGSTVLQTSPTLTTPNIGTASGTSLNVSGTLESSQVTVNGTITADSITLYDLSVSKPVSTDAFNNLISSATTGSGTTVVLSAGPTLSGTTTVGTLSTDTITSSNDLTITGDTITINPDIGATTVFNASGTITANSLDASKPVVTNASKVLTSAVTTGSGSVVLATSPTLVTPVLGAATGTSLNLSSLTATSALATDGSKNLVSVTNTGTGNNVLSASPTLTGTLNCGPVVSTGTVTGTGYVGNTTSLPAAGNIGEVLYGTAQAMTNSVNYYSSGTVSFGTTWATLVSSPTLTPGLYLCVANGYVTCVQTNVQILYNIWAGADQSATVHITNTSISGGYVSFSFSRVIRITSNQVLTLQGITNVAATLGDPTQAMTITRIG